MKLFFKKVSTLPLPLWARSTEKKLGKQWPKATPFPAGVAQSALRTARCRSYSLRAQHTSAGSVPQAIPTCAGPKSARGIGCLPNALPEKDWRHARARHSLRHSALPPKENSARSPLCKSARSPLCKNTCKSASFPVQYTKALSRFTNTKPKRPKPPGFPREGRSEHQWNPGFSKKT